MRVHFVAKWHVIFSHGIAAAIEDDRASYEVRNCGSDNVKWIMIDAGFSVVYCREREMRVFYVAIEMISQRCLTQSNFLYATNLCGARLHFRFGNIYHIAGLPVY